MKLLIVDDEPLAREGIRLLLSEDPGISSIEEARNGAEAVAAVRAARPDLVLLDVQMPEMDGFGVLRELGADNLPPVIFITAHDEYAIRAFEVNAVDYLLKPVTRERFQQAMARVRERSAQGLDQGLEDSPLRALLQQLSAQPKYLARVALRSAGRITFADVEDIQYVQAAENYVQLHLKSSRHLLHVPIATLEASLDPQTFLRIHRSLIVNVKQVRELQTGAHGEYIVVLKSGAQLHASRSYSDRIRRWAANPF